MLLPHSKGKLFTSSSLKCNIQKFNCLIFAKAVFTHERSLRDQAKKMNVSSLRSNDETQKISAEIRIAKVHMN